MRRRGRAPLTQAALAAGALVLALALPSSLLAQGMGLGFGLGDHSSLLGGTGVPVVPSGHVLARGGGCIQPWGGGCLMSWTP